MYSNHRIPRGYTYMGTERLPILPPRYGGPFYRGRGRGRGRREWLGEREKNWGFGRGSSHENGRGNGRRFHSQTPSERNQRDRQEEEWSIPMSDGRRGRDVPVSSPTIQGLQHRTPPTPAPSEDNYFTDWSSKGMGSPLVRTPPQSISVRERGQEINQATIQTSQPWSEPTQMGDTENALQEDPIVTTPTTQWQPLDALSVTDERRMIDIGTNTFDVEVEPNRDRLRTSTMEANAQTSIPIVDIMLPSGRGDHLTIPQVNLSILGYEPDSLKNSHMRSSSMRAQDISVMPQLDGLTSLVMRDLLEEEYRKFPG